MIRPLYWELTPSSGQRENRKISHNPAGMPCCGNRRFGQSAAQAARIFGLSVSEVKLMLLHSTYGKADSTHDLPVQRLGPPGSSCAGTPAPGSRSPRGGGRQPPASHPSPAPERKKAPLHRAKRGAAYVGRAFEALGCDIQGRNQPARERWRSCGKTGRSSRDAILLGRKNLDLLLLKNPLPQELLCMPPIHPATKMQ